MGKLTRCRASICGAVVFAALLGCGPWALSRVAAQDDRGASAATSRSVQQRTPRTANRSRSVPPSRYVQPGYARGSYNPYPYGYWWRGPYRRLYRPYEEMYGYPYDDAYGGYGNYGYYRSLYGPYGYFGEIPYGQQWYYNLNSYPAYPPGLDYYDYYDWYF